MGGRLGAARAQRAGERWLAEFDVDYDTEIASWATDIAAAVRN